MKTKSRFRTFSPLLPALLLGGLSACGDDDGDIAGTNLPPVANAGADAAFTDIDGDEEQQVTLDGSASTDPDGTIEIFRWTDAQGEFVAGGPIATPALPVGPHVITLTVTDDDGASDTDQVTITVQEQPANAPPVADAGTDQTVVDNDGDGSEQVTLDGSASSDADGEINLWTWTEGSATIATGQTAEVTLTVGVHTITLTVSDDLLATGTDEVVVTVEPQL
ncbi:MAG: PKD domain-containing protein [Gemmatimonadota bacterium]